METREFKSSICLKPRKSLLQPEILASSAEGLCFSVHHPSGLSMLCSKVWLEQLGNDGALQGRFGGICLPFPTSYDQGDAAGAVSSFDIFVSLSVKRTEGNCPFLFEGLASEDEKCCTGGRWDCSRWMKNASHPLWLCGGPWQSRAPTQELPALI